MFPFIIVFAIINDGFELKYDFFEILDRVLLEMCPKFPHYSIDVL